MAIKNNKNVLSFSIFNHVPNLACYMSTRQLGDMWMLKKPIQSALPLLSVIGANTADLVFMKQVHGSDISVVNQSLNGGMVATVDGIITRDTGLFLGVNTADCVPLFFFDPVKNLVGIAHAGWRGTNEEIAIKMIEKLQKLGSKSKNILVAIGPHISACCYRVPKERAALFSEKYPNDSNIVFRNNNDWFLDVGQANRVQLQQAGVLPEHIDAPIACTSCQNDLFFSYRKDPLETFGEMLGIIGMRA